MPNSVQRKSVENNQSDWQARFAELAAQYPELQSYEQAFPGNYRNDYHPEEALLDVALIAQLDNSQSIAQRLYRYEGEAASVLRLRVVQGEGAI